MKKRILVILLMILMIALVLSLNSCGIFETKHHHDWTTWELVKYPTCQEEGLAELTCNCGETEMEIIPKEDHTKSDWIVDQEPTCQKAGKKHIECIVCKTQLTSVSIPTVEHSFDSWIYEPGINNCVGAVLSRQCLTCDHVEEKIGEYSDHKFATETITSSCTKEGYEKHYCEYCDVYFVDSFVEAIGHDYSIIEEIIATTCTESGLYKKICANCGDSYEQLQNANGHSYILESEENGEKTYECNICYDIIVVVSGENANDIEGSQELFNVEPGFTFKVISSENEAHIKNNLKIIDNYYRYSEYENASEIILPYTLSYEGNNVWVISPISDYEFDTTYVAVLSDDIAFLDYPGKELTFTIINDPNHEDVYEYNNDIAFLQLLENEYGGYYPYSLSSSQESEYIYLFVNKIDRLYKDMIICVGDGIVSAEQISVQTDCYFGKIYDFYPLEDGRWVVVLSEPEITEIFDKLNVSYNKDINLETAGINEEEVEEQLVSAMYGNDDFIKLFGAMHVSTKKYFANHNYLSEKLESEKAFMDSLKLNADVTFENFVLTAKVTGNLDIPIKNSKGQEIGSFNASFSIIISSTFTLDVYYEMDDHKSSDIKIEKIDLSLTQTDTFDFDFHVSIDVEEDSVFDEQPYIRNSVNGKIHRRGCVHLRNVTDNSSYEGLSAEKAEQYIRTTPSLACSHCQPIIGLKSDLIVVNTKGKMIHAYGCATLSNINDENQKLSSQKSTYWIEQGYTCCQNCHPDSLEEFEYNAIFTQTLYCSDWQEVATNISQWAKESQISERTNTGITLFKTDIPIYGPIAVRLEVNFVLSFDLEATFEYEYSYKQITVYGLRLQNKKAQPYSSRIMAKTLDNHCSVMGEVEIKAGLLVDVNLTIIGISKWMRAGITTELGVYARLAGVLNWSEVSEENYMAAYFETGVYIDVNAYYKLLWWDGETGLYDKKVPLLTLGYQKAYFSYENYYDKIVINNSYDIAEKDLLKVKYFDLSTMTVKTDELTLKNNSNYKVNLRFADGRYLEIIDGVIVATEDAPDNFSDVLIITVVSDDNWDNFKKNSSVFYLGVYEIELEFNTIYENASEGLEFELNSDGESYSVVGIGTCTDSNVVIPSMYNNMPVTSIGSEAFFDCDSLVSVVIGDSVTSIGSDAFSDCSNLYVVYNNSDLLLEIGSYNNGCLAYNVKILVDNGETIYRNDGYNYTLTDDGFLFREKDSKYELIAYIGGEDTVTLPESINGNSYDLYFMRGVINVIIPEGFTTISDYAFYDCDILVSVVIPDSVTTIGNGAFVYCSSLVSVDIPDGVTSIGSSAFARCSSLESVIIPDSVTSIGDNTFAHCDSLTSVVIGDSVTSIGNVAFAYCYSLESVVIGDSVTSIGYEAFYRCSSLESIDIPDSVTSIGNYAFEYCYSLTSVVIPDSVTSIGISVFKYCSSLTSIVIPDSVTSIGALAFWYCSSLTSIVIPDSVTSIGGSAFSNCSSLTEVYYNGTAEEWNSISVESYGNDYLKNATRYYYSETEPTEEDNYWHWVNGEVVIWE